MAIEQACVRAVQKPWGVLDLKPWSRMRGEALPIGEIWYERPGRTADAPALLLKLLFTGQPLSIQVHPDDAAARAIGLPNGKSEAWYILSATPGAKVAVGLAERLTPEQLRDAAGDGSIMDFMAWRAVSPGGAVLVPAGTIHAIGAGVVLAEIQQRCDVTFRLFDHGRRRDLHIDSAIAVANLGPAATQPIPVRVTEARMLLASNAHFALERIDLIPESSWRLEVDQEAWILVIGGGGCIGSSDCALGDAFFAKADIAEIRVGLTGLSILAAYARSGPSQNLLRRVERSYSLALTSDDGAFAPSSLNGTGEF